MFVSASTDCFPELSLPAALDRLGDLEYTAVELALFEDRDQFKPSYIQENLEKAIEQCRNTRRLDVVAFDLRITATGEAHYEQFLAICRLAKTVKVVTLTVPSAEVGTPFLNGSRTGNASSTTCAVPLERETSRKGVPRYPSSFSGI